MDASPLKQMGYLRKIRRAEILVRAAISRSSPARRITGLRLGGIFLAVLLAGILFSGCSSMVGGTGTGGGGSHIGSSSAVSVNVTPSSASVILGATQQFSATVIGSSNPAVSWSVNGASGGTAAAGTITAAGRYTAPAILPSPAQIKVTAISLGDPAASATAAVTIASDLVVTIAPASATVTPGGSLDFTATVASQGHPNTNVVWSVNGVPGGNSQAGTITGSGADSAMYLAPNPPPNPAAVSITATSVADPSRAATASVDVVCSQGESISPASSNVGFLQTQLLSATICVAPGAAIQWDVSGVPGGSALLGTVTGGGAATAIYTAPASLPPGNPVTVHATSGNSSASATINVFDGIAVTISPASASVDVGQQMLLSATVAETTNQGVTWSVDGIANGNIAIGQICLAGSNPCLPPPGPISSVVYFLAPVTVPAVNPVEVSAIPAADPSRYSNAVLNIVNTSVVGVTISPAFAFVVPTTTAPSHYQFTARVTGASNTAVTWALSTSGDGVACAPAACGTVTASGLYTAPDSAPSPNDIDLIATSVADPAVSATSVLTITSGPSIEQILPSSVMAGVASGFTLALNGFGFVSTTAGVIPVILIDGTPRDSVCLSPLNCTTTINPSDVAAAGTVSVQVQIPGAATTLSNPVNLVVVPFDESQQAIELSADSPNGVSNIVVYEPTSAAVTTAQINVDSAGTLTAGTCTLQGKAIPVTPPATGSEIFSICVHGNTLDPAFTYQFSGPNPSDIAVAASSLATLFPNLIELDLTITSTTLPGVRTLFITTPNNDRAAASGVLEVQ